MNGPHPGPPGPLSRRQVDHGRAPGPAALLPTPDVALNPGQVLRVHYGAPMTVFSSGKIGYHPISRVRPAGPSRR